jgi:hypothetical protein
MASLIAGTNSTTGIHASVCVCVYVCMEFDIISTDLLISVFHWLHFYINGFKPNSLALLGMYCTLSVNCMCVLAGRMQPSCHMCGNTSSWKKRHLSMGKHWLHAHQIFPYPTQKPIHTDYMSLLLVSNLYQMLYCWLYSTQPLDVESCVVTSTEAVLNPYVPCQGSQTVAVAQLNLHCLGVEVLSLPVLWST